MSKISELFDSLDRGEQPEAEATQTSSDSMTSRLFDSLEAPRVSVSSENKRSESESDSTPLKDWVERSVGQAEALGALATGGLAWTAGTGLAAADTAQSLYRGSKGSGQYRVHTDNPVRKQEIIEQNIGAPELAGMPMGLRRAILERTAKPTKEVSPEEMETRRQNLRDKVQEVFSYAPKTEKGQEYTEVLMYPFEKLHEASKVASKHWLNAAGIEDPVAESVLTDALEIVAGAGIFHGVGKGVRGAKKGVKKRRNRAQTAREAKRAVKEAELKTPQKIRKYLDSLDEFGEPARALQKVRSDIKAWILDKARRKAKGEDLDQGIVDKLKDLVSEEGKYKGTDIEPLGDPDYERMMRSLDESRGKRQAPQRAEGKPLETPYVPPKEVEAPKTTEAVAPPEGPKTAEPTSVPNVANKGLKEFWDVEGANFPEFKNRTHLYNWITAWRKKQGEKGFGGHANVPHEVARQAAEAYRERVAAFDKVNEMRKAEGKRKLNKATLISDEELARVRETEGTSGRDTGLTPEETQRGPRVQETTEPSSSSDAPTIVEEGEVIRRRKGEKDVVVRDDNPPPEVAPVDEPTRPKEVEPPLVFEDAKGNIIDRRSKKQRDAATRTAVSNDPNYRRMRRRQNDLDIEGRTKLRPAEVAAREAGYLDRVRELWTQGKPRPEIAEAIATEFPNVAKEASGVGKSVESHIDLDALFNTGKYRDQIKRQQAGYGPKVNEVPDSLQKLLDQLGPPKGPNTLRSFVMIDPVVISALFREVDKRGVPLDTILQQSGQFSDAERRQIARLAEAVKKDVTGLLREEQVLKSVPYQNGKILNQAEVNRRQKKGLAAPVLRQELMVELYKNVNRKLRKEGEKLKGTDLVESFTTSPRLLRKTIGQAAIEVFHRPIHKAMASVKRELNATMKLVEMSAEANGIGKVERRRIGIYAIGKQDGGDLRLKVSREKPITWAELSKAEQAFYKTLRAKLDQMIVRLNWARENAGLNPLPERSDYFPFISVVNSLSDVDARLLKNVMDAYNQQVTAKAGQHKPFFSFERGVKGSEVKLDFVDVYRQYMHEALWHTYMTPLMGLFERVMEAKVNVADLPGYKGPTHRNRTLKNGKTRKEPITWSLAKTRGGRVKGVLQNYLSAAYGRYPDYGAQGKYKGLRTIEDGAYVMSKNVAGYLVRSLTSPFNQSASVVNTIAVTGKNTYVKAIPAVLSRQAWDQARKESSVLYNRVGSYDAYKMDRNFTAVGNTRGGSRIASAYNAAQRFGELAGTPFEYMLSAMDEFQVMHAYFAGKQLAKKWGLRGDRAVSLAEQIMLDTQGSGSMADVAGVQRTKVGRVITTLQTMVISQMNQIIGDMTVKDAYGHWKELAPKEMRGTHSRGRNAIRFMAGATTLGFVFENLMGMYSPLPNPVGAAWRALQRDETVVSMLADIFGEGKEALPVIGGTKYDATSIYGPAATQVVRAYKAQDYFFSEWNGWMQSGSDPATSMVNALWDTLTTREGEAPLALLGIPIRQYLRVAEAYYEGDDWDQFIKGYDFEEVEDRRR